MLFTDGVTEARRGDDFFGDDRLQDAVGADASAATTVARILGAALEFQNGITRDDIVIMVLRVP